MNIIIIEKFLTLREREMFQLLCPKILDDYKIKEQGFFGPSPIYSYKILIDRVDQDNHFDPGMTSVGQLQPTQFKI